MPSAPSQTLEVISAVNKLTPHWFSVNPIVGSELSFIRRTAAKKSSRKHKDLGRRKEGRSCYYAPALAIVL